MKKIFTKFFLFVALLAATANLSAQTYNGGTWYSLYDNDQKDNVVVNTTFCEKSVFAPAESITFDYKKFTVISSNGKLQVQNKVNGSWSGSKGEVKISSTSWNTSDAISLDENISHIRYYMQSSTGASVKNHRVTLKKHIRIADGGFGKTTDSKSFDNTVVGQISAVQTVKLRSFLTAGDIIVTSNTAAFRVGSSSNQGAHVFNVGANACASTNGAAGTPAGGGTLGDINLYDVNIYFCPTTLGAQSGTVTISDGVSSVTVSVSGTAIKESQTIMWDQDLTNINTTDNITLNATAETEVKYISSDSTIAYADGNQLIINQHGQFTLTAVAAESEKYNQATSIKEIVINAAQPTVSVWPTVEPIAYAQVLTSDMLVGGDAEVEGYFEWNTELNQTLVPGVHDLAVRFIPTNTAYYAPVDGTVAVTINKSTQSIVWNDAFENITILDSIVLNASAQTEITYEVSDMELAYITENNVLYFLAGGTLFITAYASENDYYLADTLVRELTILPGKPAILSWPTASDIVYGQSLAEAVLAGGEANVNGTFAWVDPSEVFYAGVYAPYVRFTPDDLESFDIVEQQVQIKVAPAAQIIEWDLTNVVMKVGETLQLTATATSGLEVAYELDNNAYAEINGNVLVALQVGTVVVTASQNGVYVDDFGDEYANYLAADPVAITITVVPNGVPTSVEDIPSASIKARKIIRNGQMFIIRGEQIYDALGNLIR